MFVWQVVHEINQKRTVAQRHKLAACYETTEDPPVVFTVTYNNYLTGIYMDL